MTDMALESLNPLEPVVDKGVHDGHGFGQDPGVGVDLLQHLVDLVRGRRRA